MAEFIQGLDCAFKEWEWEWQGIYDCLIGMVMSVYI